MAKSKKPQLSEESKLASKQGDEIRASLQPNSEKKIAAKSSQKNSETSTANNEDGVVNSQVDGNQVKAGQEQESKNQENNS